MPWYKITPATVQERVNIRNAFEAAFSAASAADWQAIGNAALYETSIRHGIRNPTALYFSPDCAIFFSAKLSEFRAAACERPIRSEVESQFGQGEFDKNLFTD